MPKMAQLRSYTFERVTDANGEPVSGGKAYVYDAGTSNLSTIYTSAAAGTPAANPIIADSAGIFPNRYLADATYDIQYTDASDVALGGLKEDIVIAASGGGGGGGGLEFDVLNKTNNYTVTTVDVDGKIPVIRCDASGLPGLELIVTIDAGTLGVDTAVWILNVGATGTIRVQPDAAETIDGASDLTLTGQGSGRGLVCIGAAGWETIASVSIQQNSLVVSATPASDETNFTAAGLSNAVAFKQINLAPTASINFNSIAGISEGERVVICNTLDGSSSSGRLVIIPHEHAASTAANRFFFADRMPRFLMPGEAISFIKAGSRLRSVDNAPYSKAFPNFTDCYKLDTYYDRVAAAGGTVSETPGAGLSIGAGDTTQKPMGQILLGTASAATGGGSLGISYTTNDKITVAPAQGQALYLVRVAVSDLSDGSQTFSVRAGFTGINAEETDVTNGVYWEYLSTAAAQWSMNCAGNGSRSKTASDISVAADTYYWLGIYINGDWSQADFFLSSDSRTWVFKGSQTGANMPTSAEPTEAGIVLKKSVGTTARFALVDLQGHRYDTYRGA
jgi:hypothetical protein